MNTSKFLAKVVGIYLILVGLAYAVNMNSLNQAFTVMISNAPLMYIAGFFTLIIGLLMVVGHNIWEWSWRVIITIIGWIVLLKAIILIAFPHLLYSFTMAFVQNHSWAYVTIIFDIVIGIILCYFGFKKTDSNVNKF